MGKPKGYIVWEGESWFDGTPIACIVTLKTSNRKTGDMAQVWILASDIDPVEAIRTGRDRSICGSCIHRGTNGFEGRSCYVDAAKAPLSVWKAYKRGSYQRISSGAMMVGVQSVDHATKTIHPLWKPTYDTSNRAFLQNLTAAFSQVGKVRLGAYGDPAFVPAAILSCIVDGCKVRTGYTHQWRDPNAAEHRTLCMASCDTYDDVREARMFGWRCFYVGAEEIRQDAQQPSVSFKSMPCPASDEAGKKTTCDRCGLCSGTMSASGRDIGSSSAVPSVITILPHGAGKKHIATKIVALTIGVSSRL